MTKIKAIALFLVKWYPYVTRGLRAIGVGIKAAMEDFRNEKPE